MNSYKGTSENATCFGNDCQQSIKKLKVGSSNELGKSPVTQGDCSRRIHT